MEVNLLNGFSLFIFYSFDDKDMRAFYSNFFLIDRDDLYKVRRFLALKDYIKNNRHIKLYYRKKKFCGEIIFNNNVEYKATSIDVYKLFFKLNDYCFDRNFERIHVNSNLRKKIIKVV